MKRKHRNNLIRLIFVHLLLLAYPLASKTLHVHHGEGAHHEFPAHVCFDQPEDFCPVCDFEFYNFVQATPTTSFIVLQCIFVNNTPDSQVVFVPFIQYFSLRAPPAA